MRSKRSFLLKLAVLGLFAGIGVTAFTQRWKVYDSWRLRGYQPAERIVQVADETTMTDKARRLFYVYRPQLNDRNAFNENCKSSERTIVLGCYVSGTGIYVYDVADERLAGIIQVTAAHEMLHAAYGRLGAKEKARINQLLESTYANVTDQRIRETVEDYRKNGAEVANELHSILATEVRSLPPQLEDYYRQYFQDRAVVVGYSEKYEQAFTERKNKVAQFDVQLDGLKKDIDAGQTGLTTRTSQLERERGELEALLAAKDYTTYNAGVGGYNAQVNSYNTEVRRLRGLIDEYNHIVAERNTIATEESELVKAIDSRPDTLPVE